MILGCKSKTQLTPSSENKTSRAWWRTPVIPALGRQRQADLRVQGQPSPQSKFQDSQGYTEKPYLEKTNQPTNKQDQNQAQVGVTTSLKLHHFQHSGDAGE